MSEEKSDPTKFILTIPIELMKEMKRIKKESGLIMHWQILEGIRMFIECNPPKK